MSRVPRPSSRRLFSRMRHPCQFSPCALMHGDVALRKSSACSGVRKRIRGVKKEKIQKQKNKSVPLELCCAFGEGSFVNSSQVPYFGTPRANPELVHVDEQTSTYIASAFLFSTSA